MASISLWAPPKGSAMVSSTMPDAEDFRKLHPWLPPLVALSHWFPNNIGTALRGDNKVSAVLEHI